MPDSSLRLFRSAVIFGATWFLAFGNTSPVRAADVAPAVRAFFEKHCVECHGDDSAKAGLRLDALPANFVAADKNRVWTKILDRIAAGEMPPQNSARPAATELAPVTNWIHHQLLAEDVRQRQAAGPLVLRRMNRLQYENTIHDLLAIKLELQDRLPADSRAFGFDNIGQALSLSSAQMEAYLEAADAALDAAIVTKPKPASTKQRMNGLAALNQFPARIGGTVLDLEEVAVAFGPHSFYASRDAAPQDGMYRVRLSAYAQNSPGKPVEIYVRSTHKTGDRVIGFYNVSPDSPQVIDFVCQLKKDARVSISTSKFRYVPRTRKPEEHPDPGLAVQWVEMEGPLVDVWPPLSHQRLFGDLPVKSISRNGQIVTVTSDDPLADTTRLLVRFLRQAYRRPVTDAEVQPFVDLVTQHLESKHSFEESMRVGYKAILCSPDFLFFQEKRATVDTFALASRLSYFLWNTMPDDELMKLAETGELARPETLRAQVERLLTHANSQGFIQNFLAQWLDLRMLDFTMPDRKLYPEFDAALRDAMAKETELFFADVLRRDLSVTNFVDSDFTFLNERLANHYGIEGVKGAELRAVPLPPGSHRGGVLTMASVLKVTANGSYTHPVHRGVWVLKNILGQPPDPPPPNAGAIEPDLRGAKTIREQLAIHRQATTCAGCHVKIDPLGFALENFDVTGAWREKYRILSGPMLSLSHKGPAVEASYELPDGRPFKNIDELKKLLLDDKEQIARCLSEKLLIYGTGKGLRYADREVVKDILVRSQKSNYGLRTIIHEIIQSPTFVTP